MQNGTSRFTVNIVPLQNIQSNITALSAYTTVANNIANIQKMVNYDTKTVYTDTIRSFTPGNTIQFENPVNLTTASSGSSSSLLQQSTSVTLYTTSSITQTAIAFSVNNNPILQITGNGNVLYNDMTRTATEFVISSVTLKADDAVFNTMMASTVTARNYLTLSDTTIKSNIREWRLPILKTLTTIKPYAFTYADENIIPGNIGLMAQEVAAEYPQCVNTIHSTMYIKYDSMVAVLLGAVKELSAKVSTLEGNAR